MDINTIITLLNAGYTKEDIDGMVNSTADPDPTPAASETVTETETDHNTQNTVSESTDTVEVPVPSQLSDNSELKAIDELKAIIAEQTKDIAQLKSQLVTKNINTISQPTPSNTQTIYDVLAGSIK